MTFIIATPEKIYVDTRVTLKDTLVDCADEEHLLELTYDGINKISSTGVRSTGDTIHHTVGFGDVRVIRALNHLLSCMGIETFTVCIPALAKLMPKATYPTGLVWVNDDGDICSIQYDHEGLTYSVYEDDVVAFGKASGLLGFLKSFDFLTPEEIFLLTCDHCEYSSKGDYYVYDVARLKHQRHTMESGVFDRRISEIKSKLGMFLLGNETGLTEE